MIATEDVRTQAVIIKEDIQNMATAIIKVATVAEAIAAKESPSLLKATGIFLACWLNFIADFFNGFNVFLTVKLIFTFRYDNCCNSVSN